MDREHDIEFLKAVGFQLEKDECGRIRYVKRMAVCNSNCIGCEYCIFLGVSNVVDIDTTDSFLEVEMHLYKTPLNDEKGVPKVTICLNHTQRRDMREAVMDMVLTVSSTLKAMDFQQISGTDFIDFSRLGSDISWQDAEGEYRRIAFQTYGRIARQAV